MKLEIKIEKNEIDFSYIDVFRHAQSCKDCSNVFGGGLRPLDEFSGTEKCINLRVINQAEFISYRNGFIIINQIRIFLSPLSLEYVGGSCRFTASR